MYRYASCTFTGSYCPAQEKCCFFPFDFEGKTYHSCTTDGTYFNYSWCSFDNVYKGNWAYCGKKNFMRRRLVSEMNFNIILCNKLSLLPVVRHSDFATCL